MRDSYALDTRTVLILKCLKLGISFLKNLPSSSTLTGWFSTTTRMLTRRVHIRVRQRRIGTLTQRIPPCSLPHPNLSPGQGSRHFSLSTITDPINNAVATLPLQIQYTIPETILNLSEAYVPAGLPTYTTGIVVFAFLTRLAFFTPWSLWVSKLILKL